MRRAARCWLLSLALAGSAGAGEEVPGAGHHLSVYLHGGMQVYQAPTRLMGGVGGGVGLRDTWNERLLLQADVSYLFLLGNVTALRVAAGYQHPGTWSPAALLGISLLMGDQASFLTPDVSAVRVGPALSLGITLAPLRFRAGSVQVSLLAPGLSAGSDFPGTGLCYSLSLLEVSAGLD